MISLFAALAMQASAPPTPPQLPPIALERSLSSETFAAAHRRASALAESYERDVERWAQTAREVREHLTSAAADQWTEATLERAQALIDDIEAIAQHRAVWLARLRKQSGRDVKAMFNVDPAAAASMKQVADRLVSADERAIEMYLDSADFLRALKADMTTDRGDARTFDDPAEMAAFLRQSLGV